jgi:FkbM family methyltransferase
MPSVLGLFARRIFDAVADRIPARARSRLLHRWLEQSVCSRAPGLKEISDTRWVLQNLHHAGFLPAQIIDCGAYVGKWTCMARTIFPDAKVLMVEAAPENEPALSAVATTGSGVSYAIALLGPNDRGTVPYFKMATGSSVLAEQTDVSREVVHLPMTTLDRLAISRGIRVVDLLKLDVQGFELEVLRGAEALLQTAQVVLLEVSFLQYNAEAPLVHEVFAAMRSYGFLAYDIGATTRWGTSSKLLQADILFVRCDSPLRPERFNF